MKPQAEIERIHDAMANRTGEVAEWMGDNFKAGFYAGKLIALEWALGDAPGSGLAIDHDYESWMREAEGEL